MQKPFIYIASLRRTGSTVLSEALTLFPHSFIFREPGLSRRTFKIKSKDVDLFLAHGVKLKGRQKEIMKKTSKELVVTFKKTLLPELLNVVSQVGVKEIHHEHWENLADAFPNMKVIVTGRDPRDIYISVFKK